MSELTHLAHAEEYLIKHHIAYRREAHHIIVPGDITIQAHQTLRHLPDLSAVIVEGSFYCSGQNLASLKGSPQKVEGDYICYKSGLKSLKCAPETVSGTFDCDDNQLTSLDGAPHMVGGSFTCKDNLLTSLRGAPRTVGTDFDCRNNKLTSLRCGPAEVGCNYFCSNNQLISLVGIAGKLYHKVRGELCGNLHCENNMLRSLQGLKPSFHGNIHCEGNAVPAQELISGFEAVRRHAHKAFAGPAATRAEAETRR